jgi:hypothetical protein
MVMWRKQQLGEIFKGEPEVFWVKQNGDVVETAARRDCF